MSKPMLYRLACVMPSFARQANQIVWTSPELCSRPCPRDSQGLPEHATPEGDPLCTVHAPYKNQPELWAAREVWRRSAWNARSKATVSEQSHCRTLLTCVYPFVGGGICAQEGPWLMTNMHGDPLCPRHAHARDDAELWRRRDQEVLRAWRAPLEIGR